MDPGALVGMPSVDSISCPASTVGRVIGRGGETIKSLQASTGARISVGKEGDPREIKLTGSVEQVAAAKTALEKTINGAEHLGGGGYDRGHDLHDHGRGNGHAPPPTSSSSSSSSSSSLAHRATVMCPKDCVGAVVGHGGESLRALQERTHARFHLERDPTHTVDPLEVAVEAATEQALAAAVAALRAAIAAAAIPPDYEGAEGRAARAAARAHGDERHRLLDAAHAAFEAGDKPKAHELSQQGHERGRQMEEADERAVAAILAHRNAGKGALYLDLHGLTVAEALAALEARLAELGRDPATKEAVLLVIPGAGHHSAGHTAKLKPAVRAELRRRGLPCKPRDAGSFEVELGGTADDDDSYGDSYTYGEQQQHVVVVRQEAAAEGVAGIGDVNPKIKGTPRADSAVEPGGPLANSGDTAGCCIVM